MSEALDNIANVEREELRKLLAQCRPAQILFFNQVYVSVEKIPQEKIRLAIQQCKDVIAKNG